MNVRDLIAELSSMDPDADVRVAVQPSYPMEADFLGVTVTTYTQPTGCKDCNHGWHAYGTDCPTIAEPITTDAEGCDCPGDFDDDDKDTAGVWLIIGDHTGYGVPSRIHPSFR